MTTDKHIIKALLTATLISYKQGNISLNDTVEIITDAFNLATPK